MEHKEPQLRDQKLDKFTTSLLEARSKALAGIVGGSHRMELVQEMNGIAVINDSKATFLDATMETMHVLTSPIVWIVEGVDHNRGYDTVSGMIKEKVKNIIVYGQKEEAIKDSLEGCVTKLMYVEELRTAVFLSNELAEEGDTILFSPACPSGRGYANYEERGAEFKNAVNDL